MRAVKYCAWIMIVVSSLAAPAARAKTQCHTQARTAYETLFCDLQEKGAGNLPTFESFRANSPRIQAVLLKQPARKYGMKIPPLPKPGSKPSAPSSPRPAVAAKPTASKTISSKAVDSQLRASTVSDGASTTARPPGPNSKPVVTPSALKQCQLREEQIRCTGQYFNLAHNLPNKALARDVLSEKNRFGLRSFHGDPNNARALNVYLSDSYRHYIDKMLMIGLGASTMSYTKFHYTYMELAGKNTDFSQRFEEMYRYLKIDKAALAVKSRYNDQLPQSMDLCQDLSNDIIVCDNGTTNWVYVRAN